MERWSYKPEVEGLSPSLGTNLSGRDSSPAARDWAEIVEFEEARRPHAPATILNGDVAPTGRAAVS